MQKNEVKDINFLGQKRNLNDQMPITEIKFTEEEKVTENNLKQLSPKKSEIFITFKGEKNRINLGEKNETKIDDNTNNNIKAENEIHNQICQKCNSGDNVLSFNNFKSILDYLSKENILLIQNYLLYENLNFDPPKVICSNCLLEISKNSTEFEKFFALNNQKINDDNDNDNDTDNDNPFYNLLENPNLKNFNNIETEKNSTKMNNKFKNIFENFYSPDAKIPTLLNNAPRNNNNIFNNPNINFDFLNISNYLPSINFNIPFNQNISNLNIPNFINNDLNTNLTNPEMKNNIINHSNPKQHPTLNFSDILQNTLLNKPLGLFPQNNNSILNTLQKPIVNKNQPMETNNKNENGQNTTTNDINNKNNIEKKENDTNENFEKNDLSKTLTLINNRDFDEIFKMTNSLYNKLLDIKVSRDLKLATKKIFDKNNQILLPNYLNFMSNMSNNAKDNRSVKVILEQNRKDNNFNKNNFKYNINKSSNDSSSTQNIVENHK